ncbi:hypothetical protein [Streptosporangium sp. NPDC006930]|uniref:hypothetical protein n=1 Tax=Streptosporangium sp. NPDC006930 TaxID=3154783 RepID=UPI00344203AA
MAMVTLHWRWKDSDEHDERKAPYASLDDAQAQADHDLALCVESDDYSSAPVRIENGEGVAVWTAPIPDGR